MNCTETLEAQKMAWLEDLKIIIIIIYLEKLVEKHHTKDSNQRQKTTGSRAKFAFEKIAMLAER